VQAQLVDEMVYYMAPCLMGSEARPLLDLPIGTMAGKRAIRIGSIDRVGEDVRMVLNFT
jgi:diaminohydroxyphosphoribosylaminopyrimidine deaminase/5-amino-6-(5-phosphoribosylamino)uracil reductase